MEDALVELTESQIVKDNFAKAMLGAAAGFAAGNVVARVYDYGMKAYRLKKATTGES